MAKPHEIVVNTLTEFTSEVEKALSATIARNVGAQYRGNWYRGHGEDSFVLKPTLYRHPTLTRLEDALNLEQRMLDDFRRQSFLHKINTTSEENARFEMLFYMQHHGVPTRLLDWTGNPFIALYFALTNSPGNVDSSKAKEDASVWILDPVGWNAKAMLKLSWTDQRPALIEDEVLNSFRPQKLYTPILVNDMYPYPVAMLGVSNNARMFAQKGVFTIFGSVTDPMEIIYDTAKLSDNSTFQDTLAKLIIKKDRVADMLRSLVAIGFTDSVSYPDLHGLAMEIKRLNGFDI